MKLKVKPSKNPSADCGGKKEHKFFEIEHNVFCLHRNPRKLKSLIYRRTEKVLHKPQLRNLTILLVCLLPPQFLSTMQM